MEDGHRWTGSVLEGRGEQLNENVESCFLSLSQYCYLYISYIVCVSSKQQIEQSKQTNKQHVVVVVYNE